MRETTPGPQEPEDLRDRPEAVEAIHAETAANLDKVEALAGIGHWTLDLRTNHLHWSDEIYRIFDIDPAQFGASYEAFLHAIHPDDRETVNEAYTRSLETRTKYHIDHRLLMDDGRIKYVQERCETEYDDQGDPIRSMGTVQDITERVKAEQSKRRADRLDSLGVLAGGIAHDFNNILMGVLGNLDLILRTDSDPVEAQQLLEDARFAALRARDLAGQLLSFSRGGDPDIRVVEPTGLLEETTRFFLTGSNVDVRFDFQEHLPNIEADPGQVSQVIQNLVINAVKAMPEGGTLNVGCHKGSAAESNESVEIVIADQGGGMPPEVVDRIFDPFFSATSGGSGLGLAIVHSIMKKHGGRIEVDSQEGVGTEFRLSFPASRADVTEESRPIASAHRTQGRVLVMDDQDIVLSMARKMFERIR